MGFFIKLCLEGPEKELLQLAVFGELQALFPGVHVHIEFVGPAIPQHRSDVYCNVSFVIYIGYGLV